MISVAEVTRQSEEKDSVRMIDNSENVELTDQAKLSTDRGGKLHLR